MRFPKRFAVVPAYIANAINPKLRAPGLVQLARFLCQPGKEARARRFIEGASPDGRGRIAVRLKENPARPLYIPESCRWTDFCQTVDECFNESNWHNFLSPRFRISPDDTVVDCGAAEGLFAWRAANSGAKVFAVEPDAKFAEAMRETFAGLPRVEVRQCALGHRRGVAAMSDDGIFSRITSGGNGIPTPVETLDDIAGDERVTFLKADVEGHEFRALLGAERILRRDRPRVAFTVYHPQNNVEEMKDFLRECCPGYQFATKGIFDNGNPVLMQAWV